jgi:hypothetical protein
MTVNEGAVSMTERSIVEDSAPTKHAVRIEWFRSDPGGTMFIVPPGDSTPKPIVEERDGGVTNRHN